MARGSVKAAARALAKVVPEVSFPVLSTLAVDDEWFVRLRAVIALSSFEHSGKIYVLLRALCDLNRHVRQRSAWTLARMYEEKPDILEKVVATRDNYALQAFLSVLQPPCPLHSFWPLQACLAPIDGDDDIAAGLFAGYLLDADGG